MTHKNVWQRFSIGLFDDMTTVEWLASGAGMGCGVHVQVNSGQTQAHGSTFCKLI